MFLALMKFVMFYSRLIIIVITSLHSASTKARPPYRPQVTGHCFTNTEYRNNPKQLTLGLISPKQIEFCRPNFNTSKRLELFLC